MALITLLKSELSSVYSIQWTLNHPIDQTLSADGQKRVVYDYGAQTFNLQMRFRFFEETAYLALFGKLFGYSRADRFSIPIGAFSRMLPQPDPAGVLAGGSNAPIADISASNGYPYFLAAATAGANTAQLTLSNSELTTGAENISLNAGALFSVQGGLKLYQVVSGSGGGVTGFRPGLWESSPANTTIIVGDGLRFIGRLMDKQPRVRRDVDGWFTATINFAEDGTPE